MVHYKDSGHQLVDFLVLGRNSVASFGALSKFSEQTIDFSNEKIIINITPVSKGVIRPTTCNLNKITLPKASTL